MEPIASQDQKTQKQMRMAMHLSLFVGFAMLAMKMSAYLLTGSSAILSDAAESVVHVAAVIFATVSLAYTVKKPDGRYPYGYGRIAFLSAGFEGFMIALAAGFIIYDSVEKIIVGPQIQNIDWGTSLIGLSLVLNGFLGVYLVVLGKKKHSIILEANGKHVLTDAWTSLGVLIGLGLIYFTEWLYFDPICALLVAANILWAGFGLIKESVYGIMDRADPEMREKIMKVLKEETDGTPIKFHELRHRNVGNGHWVDVHLLFDDNMPIVEAHDKALVIEKKIESILEPGGQVATHIEPLRAHKDVHKHKI